jgi:hypothetical protein
MKFICACGKVSYEAPLDNFATRHVPCSTTCRPHPPNTQSTQHERGRLSDCFPNVTSFAAHRVGMLGH